MVKFQFLHFHTLPLGLLGWILYLPSTRLPAWLGINLYKFRFYLYWPNISYLSIVPGGCQHIPWTFENFPEFLGCQLLCRPGHIPPALPVPNRCRINCARLWNPVGSGLMLALLCPSTGPPGLNFVFTISLISSLTNNTAVSILIPFVLAQYINTASSYWQLSANSLDIWNFPQIIGMPVSM